MGAGVTAPAEMSWDDAMLAVLERIEEDLHELSRAARRQEEWLAILVRQGR